MISSWACPYVGLLDPDGVPRPETADDVVGVVGVLRRACTPCRSTLRGCARWMRFFGFLVDLDDGTWDHPSVLIGSELTTTWRRTNDALRAQGIEPERVKARAHP